MAHPFLKKLVIEGDALIAGVCLGLRPSVPGLLIFVFHSLFESAQEIAANAADPQQAVTTGMFRIFVENLQKHGYYFVSPERILAGLDPAGKYAMITFDDGYANNRRALPVMEEFEAPAVFCISTNHVYAGKPFWWDVLYREAHKRAWPDERLDRARSWLKRLRTGEIEEQLVAEFGRPAFQTISDSDRPFTIGELAQFARHPLVHIGNHTCDHAILTNYPILDASEQVNRAQCVLREITGRSPQVIAYPNGNVSKPILHAVHDAGLVLGMTAQPGRNSIASTRPGTRSLLLKRQMLWGIRDIAAQCRVARSPISFRATWAAIRSRVGAVA